MSGQEHSDLSFKQLLIERYEDLEFVGSEAEDLRCVKCQDVVILVNLTNCEHVLCVDCHTKLMRRKNQECPKCKSIISNDKLDKVSELKELEKKIDRLVIKCLNHQSGCKYENQLGKMEDHFFICRQLEENNLVKVSESIKISNHREEIQNEDTEQEILFTPDELNTHSNVDTNEELFLIPFPTDSSKELNILLLGPTGVGKSTFINAFANYLKFEDLKSTKAANLEVLIPCKFTIYDEHNVPRDISVGSDSNENFQTGESGTQKCKKYEFNRKGYVIRMFDTPGVGDTRGEEQDKINLEKTFKMLLQFQHLHSICVVLKPNESRITKTFKYCIEQSLRQLQKTAVDNIVFVLTHTRGTNYNPGDTMNSLREVLNRIKSASPHIKVPLSSENVFCLENDNFKYLLAVQNHVKFDIEDQEGYEKSWKISKNKCTSLIDYIIKNCEEKPYDIRDALCVNSVRKAIVELSEPLAQTNLHFGNNLQVLAKHIADVRSCNSSMQLRQLMYIPIVKNKFRVLDVPRVVCQSITCSENYIVRGMTNYNRYHKICCHSCNCEEASQNTSATEYSTLFKCKAFHNLTGDCLKCRCSYRQHKKIFVERFMEVEKIFEDDVLEELRNNWNFVEVTRKMINKLVLTVSKWKKEEDMLTKHMAKLAIFLKMNAIITYNDVFEVILDQQIENEKASTPINDDAIKGLEQIKLKYRKEKEIVERAITVNGEEAVTTDEVTRIMNELYSMEMSGEIFTQATRARLIEQEMVRPGSNITSTSGNTLLGVAGSMAVAGSLGMAVAGPLGMAVAPVVAAFSGLIVKLFF